MGCFWADCARCAVRLPSASDLRLLGHFQCIINLNSEVSHRAFKFGVAKKQLDGTQVLGEVVPEI